MILLVIDELNEIEKNFGEIDSGQITKIIDFSREQNFDCLSFVGLQLDVIFNGEQMGEVKKELEIIQQNQVADQKIINLIRVAVDFGTSDNYLYLRFQN